MPFKSNKESTPLSEQSDFELAQTSGEGNMDAFEIIYERYHRRVFCLSLRMLQNIEKAEDITHDVFVQLHRKIGSFRGDSAFSTWLHRFTVNQVLMEMRKNSYKNEKLTDSEDFIAETDRRRYRPEKYSHAERITWKKAVDQLPPGYKNVYLLHDVEGLEHSEVAERLGCSVGTSKSQLHKARVKLHKLMTKKANPRLVTQTA